MKKNLLVSCLLAIVAFTVNAQITITQADVPVVGEVFYTGNDTVSIISPGGTGSQTWSFPSLVAHKVDTGSFTDPAGTPGIGYFPGADLCMEQQTQGLISGYVYLESNASEVSQMGVYGDFGFGMMPLIFEPPMKIVTFPSTSQTQFSGTSRYGVQFAYSQPPIDSVKSVTTHSYTSIVDAYGTLTTPGGTYSVLRQFVVSTQLDSLFLHNSISNSWSFNPPPTTKYDTTYRFLSNTDFIPLEIDKTGKASFAMGSGTGLIPLTSSENYLFVYPNPASDIINFEGNLYAGSTLVIFDINGKQISVVPVPVLNTKVSIDTYGYDEGMYLYNITGEDKKVLVNGTFNIVK